nr:hypothetical protein [Paraburkholderia bonniea]
MNERRIFRVLMPMPPGSQWMTPIQFATVWPWMAQAVFLPKFI